MPEQTRDSTPPQGRRTRRTAPGSGLALCGLGIRPIRPRPFPRAGGLCPEVHPQTPPDQD
ncbi:MULTISPECIES: hypothetical protein [Nocardia]|uniref:Uncharacterized protein n=1 Tax=Nocardia coubleae TaxID=356147 RepID=A0A846WER8_9NOCA|nr:MULTISPECIES: hypothetical protein [Nocardia]MCA2211079.1 hypothetical protein [Nocardia rosealba]NKX91124.1 hypothetical protein [Nocardia coubleae]